MPLRTMVLSLMPNAGCVLGWSGLSPNEGTEGGKVSVCSFHAVLTSVGSARTQARACLTLRARPLSFLQLCRPQPSLPIPQAQMPACGSH